MPKAFESPLLSHVRTLAMLHAVIELRVLSHRLNRAFALRRGLEACWAGSAIGLEQADLVGAPGGSALASYLRARGQGVPASRAARHLLSAEPESLPVSPLERLQIHLGSALALKQQSAGAMLAFAAQDDLTAAEWMRLLKLAHTASPAMVLIVAPPRTRRGTSVELSRLAARAVAASHAFLPVVPVDAGDPIALYRVTQESLVRARSDSGLVVVDCVASGTDPVELLGRQAIAKGLIGPAALARIEPTFRARLQPA